MADDGRDVRRRIRRAVIAKHAVSPKLRGQYHRSVHARRIKQEAQGGPPSPPQRPVARARMDASGDPPPPPRGRRIAPWVFLAALLPLLLLGVIGAFAINLAQTVNENLDKVVQPTLPRGTSAAAVTGTPRPTNTPNAQGTIAPLPTVAPAPTEDPIATVNFDRKDPFTIMLIGVDARDGEESPQSDTIILVYIDPTNKDDTVHMLSIPRDLLVTTAGGFGQMKMSDVYATGQLGQYLDPKRGGIALVRDTVEQNFRVQIDFYAQVDFNGFRKIIDTIGGVTVDNPYPIKDDAYPTEDYQYTRVFFPAGTMHLYGDEALKFARTRHDDNDYARNARQQQVLLGIRQQALQLNLLPKTTSLINDLGDAIRTDFPIKEQGLAFAKFGAGVQGSAIRQFTLTDLLGQTTINGIFYTTIDWTKARQRAKEFSPKENKDFIAGQASAGVNKGAAVVVENGTNTPGIASNWATALKSSRSYTNTAFIDAPPPTKGKVPKTKILYFAPENEKTAQDLAVALGLPATSVDGKQQRPAEAGAADILILLGDDARAP